MQFEGLPLSQLLDIFADSETAVEIETFVHRSQFSPVPFVCYSKLIAKDLLESMFSGIVENMARVLRIDNESESQNVHLTLTVPFWDELTIDQSISHNGVCLTVVSLHPDEKSYTVTAISETLLRSNLGDLEAGSLVNVERSMPVGGRLDGHIVQGHVDTTAVVSEIREAEGSAYFTIKYKVDPLMAAKGYTTVEKGSVCVNGVSLTVVDSGVDEFKVAIIPYTIEHTNFHTLKIGDRVNLEFDIIGKYLAKMMMLESLAK